MRLGVFFQSRELRVSKLGMRANSANGVIECDPTLVHTCVAMDISNELDASDVDELYVPEEPQSGQKDLSSFHESTF